MKRLESVPLNDRNGIHAAAEPDDSRERTMARATDGPATLDDVAQLLRGIQSTIAAGQDQLLDAEAAAELAGVSRATWDRMRSAGEVPAPVKLKGGSIIRWRRAILLRWIADGCPPCK